MHTNFTHSRQSSLFVRSLVIRKRPLLRFVLFVVVQCYFVLVVKMSTALKNWIEFASDGASVMTGTKSGVAAKLCEKIPQLFTWHCLCHRLELSVHDVIKDCAGVSRFQSLMDKL